MNKHIESPNHTPRSPQGEVHSTYDGMHFGALPELFEFAKKLRRNQTPAEDILWNRIRNKQLKGYKFRRQHPIDRFIADFYCHKLKFVIELDGGYHQNYDQVKDDINRDGEMKELGIFVLRIKDEQILYEFDNTIDLIKTNLVMRTGHLLEEAGR